MRTRRWMRKAVKWGGAAACVVLLGAWIGTGWWIVGWNFTNGNRAEVGWGGINVHSIWRFGTPGAFAFRHEPPVFASRHFWWPPVYLGLDRIYSLAGVKFWLLLALLAPVTAAAWRFDALARRRERAGHCGSCGYDRTGVPADSVCPECGAHATTRAGGRTPP